VLANLGGVKCPIIGIAVCVYLTVGAAVAGYHFSHTPPHTRPMQSFKGLVQVALFWPIYS
jgi:hypothetical protein